MRTYLRIDKDATIYERFPTRTTGLDEMLEIGKVVDALDGPTMYASASTRALLSFDITQTEQFPTSSQYFLRLFLANGKDVRRRQTLEVYHLEESWEEGSGYFYQTTIQDIDGVTWNEAPAYSSEEAPETTTLEDYPISDIRINITDIITYYQEQEDPTWNGIIVKFPDGDEVDHTNRGNIKVFSCNTHTIYEPLVEVVYDSQVFTTGSLKPIPSSKVNISARNIKQAYTRGEIDKIRFVVRDQYPDKRFDATPRYRNQYYLPSSSYYRIVDEVSGVKIHDFDQYSAINCDASGSYITLDTTGLDVGRCYRLELKVVTDNLVFFPETVYSFVVDTDAK